MVTDTEYFYFQSTGPNSDKRKLPSPHENSSPLNKESPRSEELSSGSDSVSQLALTNDHSEKTDDHDYRTSRASELREGFKSGHYLNQTASKGVPALNKYIVVRNYTQTIVASLWPAFFIQLKSCCHVQTLQRAAIF